MLRILFFLVFTLALNTLGNTQLWNTDFEIAHATSIKKEKPILMVFQGSDWCAPCRKLDKEVWDTEVFKNYAKENYVLLKLDFPRKKKNKLSEKEQEQNNRLAEEYNRDGGFPLVVVLDKNKKVLGKIGYLGLGPKEYIEKINSIIR
jgi:thioredoxin-related protein